MYVEKIYPNQRLRELYEEAGLPFPDDVPNENQTFENYKVDTTENITKQLDQNRYDSLDETSEILRERKVYNATRQQNILQLLKNNKTSAAIYLSLLVAFTIGAVVGTPLLAIGVVLNAALLASIIAYSTIKVLHYNNISIQNIGIEILLAGIKDNIPTTHISPEENTNLLNILDNAVNSVDNKRLDLIDKVHKYNRCKNKENTSYNQNTEKLALTNQIKEFSNLVFGNIELTEHLEKLGFNVDAVKDGIAKYIDKTTLDKLSQTIEGVKYNPLKKTRMPVNSDPVSALKKPLDNLNARFHDVLTNNRDVLAKEDAFQALLERRTDQNSETTAR